MVLLLSGGLIPLYERLDRMGPGEWHRMGLASGHLANLVEENEAGGYFTVGLLGNCNSLIGMLGGLQGTGTPEVRRTVGLVWVDALDPEEAQGHPRPVAGGPSSQEMATMMTEISRFRRWRAFGSPRRQPMRPTRGGSPGTRPIA